MINISPPIGLFMCGGLYLSCVICTRKMREIHIVRELHKKWKKLWRIGKTDRQRIEASSKELSMVLLMMLLFKIMLYKLHLAKIGKISTGVWKHRNNEIDTMRNCGNA